MSGGKFTPVKGLDQLVARMIVNNVQEVVRATEAEAKITAPDTKKWIDVGDAFVRRTHRSISGEEIPANLRFELDAYQWDVEHPGSIPAKISAGGGHSLRDAPLAGSKVYMLAPRDTTPGHYVNVVHCRCKLEVAPNGMARFVGSTPAKAVGTTVSGKVYAKGKYVIPAEYGDVYPGGFIAEGTYWMHGVVGTMKARLGI